MNKDTIIESAALENLTMLSGMNKMTQLGNDVWIETLIDMQEKQDAFDAQNIGAIQEKIQDTITSGRAVPASRNLLLDNANTNRTTPHHEGVIKKMNNYDSGIGHFIHEVDSESPDYEPSEIRGEQPSITEIDMDMGNINPASGRSLLKSMNDKVDFE